MNPFQANTPPETEVQYFKEKVQRWLNVDKQIAELEKTLKELKKVRNKELEPEITKFMTTYNVTDLNTETGKLRCQERKTKQGINKINIRQNLTQYFTNQDKLDEAIQTIWDQREVKVSYKLKKLK
tara:strand:+ start:487 stop:864 length:378 start_codon:yes stop_codon:yes gene_type:complete